jgi:hypothetical protein
MCAWIRSAREIAVIRLAIILAELRMRCRHLLQPALRQTTFRADIHGATPEAAEPSRKLCGQQQLQADLRHIPTRVSSRPSHRTSATATIPKPRQRRQWLRRSVAAAHLRLATGCRADDLCHHAAGHAATSQRAVQHIAAARQPGEPPRAGRARLQTTRPVRWLRLGTRLVGAAALAEAADTELRLLLRRLLAAIQRSSDGRVEETGRAIANFLALVKSQPITSVIAVVHPSATADTAVSRRAHGSAGALSTAQIVWRGVQPAQELRLPAMGYPAERRRRRHCYCPRVDK